MLPNHEEEADSTTSEEVQTNNAIEAAAPIAVLADLISS